jgi:hypothetical protein
MNPELSAVGMIKLWRTNDRRCIMGEACCGIQEEEGLDDGRIHASRGQLACVLQYTKRAIDPCQSEWRNLGIGIRFPSFSAS